MLALAGGYILLNELTYLYVLLLLALILGPLMTRRFFLGGSKIYGIAHLVAFLTVAIGLTFSIYELYFSWIIFCIFGFLTFLKKEARNLLSLEKLARSIPFVFSIISSVWLFGGANDLFLLGYNREWSYYAALHGNYLGWILIGSFTLISSTLHSPLNKLYLVCAFLFLIFFLLIAFGIDGTPYIKRIGAMGVVTATPLLIGYYTYSLRKNRGLSFYFSSTSLISILFTLYLAASNEMGFLSPLLFLNTPSMVSLHGLVNGLIAIPSLYLALLFDGRINAPAC